MKSRLTSKLKSPITDRLVSTSLQRNRGKKTDNKTIIAKKTLLNIKDKNKPILEKPRIISVVQQKTQPIKNRKKKTVKQEPEFLREFEEITKIYQNSQEIENEEEISLFCLDETLQDFRPEKKLQSFNSTFNRYSEKSISQLPSIAQKDIEEEKQDDITMFCHEKRINSNLSTATNYHTKTLKRTKENYINDFDLRLRGGSHQKKLAIDVQNLIKSRSKAKSSMSNQSAKGKGKN